MYLFYIDESGDIGLTNSPTRYFALSALVVHELSWQGILQQLVNLRRDLRQTYGLKLREEIHAAHFLTKPGALARIEKHKRLMMLRDTIRFEASLAGQISIVNVIVDKSSKTIAYDVFDNAWRAIIQRIQNTIAYKNFPGSPNANDRGMLIVDRTDEVKLRNLLRRMRVYNPVPNIGGSGYRLLPITHIVEDAVHRDSLHSYFIQLADVNAYFLYQKFTPNSYVARKGARNYFDRLGPVLCTVANRTHPQGIVVL
jgi:hypothetical protein